MKEYVLTIIGISVITLVSDSILVEGKIKRYAHFAIAVILSIALIYPALNLLKGKEMPNFALEQQEIDYSFSVEQTVKTFYKNAMVTVSQDSGESYKIYINLANEKILDKAQAELFKNEVKKVLSGLYSIDEENIIITF